MGHLVQLGEGYGPPSTTWGSCARRPEWTRVCFQAGWHVLPVADTLKKQSPAPAACAWAACPCSLCTGRVPSWAAPCMPAPPLNLLTQLWAAPCAPAPPLTPVTLLTCPLQGLLTELAPEGVAAVHAAIVAEVSGQGGAGAAEEVEEEEEEEEGGGVQGAAGPQGEHVCTHYYASRAIRRCAAGCSVARKAQGNMGCVCLCVC